MLCGAGAGVRASRRALFYRGKHEPVVLVASPAAASSEEAFLHRGDNGALPFPLQQERWPGNLMRKTKGMSLHPKTCNLLI